MSHGKASPIYYTYCLNVDQIIRIRPYDNEWLDQISKTRFSKRLFRVFGVWHSHEQPPT